MFRVILALLFVGFVAHRGYYSRKLAPAPDATLIERPEGAVTKAANILSIPALLSVVLYCVRPRWMSFASLPLPTWLRWLGVAIASAGFALLQWSQRELGRNWSDTPRMMKEQEMVAGGPYRWIRHPIYAAFLLILSAPLLISANWLIGGLWLTLTVLDVSSRIRAEEAMMLARFGERYAAYMKKTGALLPRF